MMQSHDAPIVFLLGLRVHWSILGVLHLLLEFLQNWLDLFETFGRFGSAQCLYFRHLLLNINY